MNDDMVTKIRVNSSKRQDLQGVVMKIFAVCKTAADFVAGHLGHKSLFKFGQKSDISILVFPRWN